MKAISSGLKTSNTAVHLKPCWYLGSTVVGANTETLKVYDSATTTIASHLLIDNFKCTTQELNICHILKEPIWCAEGVTGINSGTAGFIIWYAL